MRWPRRATRWTSGRSSWSIPIKTLGFHAVPVRVHHEVQAEVKLTVVAE